ncbi:hypothetical protein H4Q26_010083 [Puccinia striiformis f. sp. tritici PST-130]|nr:hypothetical protein H4Q26_010083 [Puccinia striiformis f. sp. tritici PST-130]
MEQQQAIPRELLAVVQYLRSKAELKTKTGVPKESERLFKGKAAIKALLSPAYAKIHPANTPAITDEAAATALLEYDFTICVFFESRKDESIDTGAESITDQSSPIYESVFGISQWLPWASLDSSSSSAIIRLILYIITWLAVSPGIWLFPNLFEDVGFVKNRKQRELQKKRKRRLQEEQLINGAAPEASAASSGNDTPAKEDKE